jgi:hypothetical protein
VRKSYKWYQFLKKWWSLWNEASTLRDEEKSDRAIYKMASQVVFDPVGNANSPLLPYMANIAQLAEANLVLDAERRGLKFSREVDPLAKIMGATYNDIFNHLGSMRDANNKAIDELLGQAAAAAQNPR